MKTHGKISLFIALLCALMLSIVYYQQYHLHLMPCPLCIVQRLIMMAIGLLFLFTALLRVEGLKLKIISALGLLLATAGGASALRQVWLQAHPPASGDVCASLGFLLNQLEFSQVLSILLKGTADCAKIDWTFWGLTTPAWAAIGFLLLAVLCVVLLVRRGA